MAFSSDPFAYSPEEHELFLAATGQEITLQWPDKKTAMHKRHRFYALRKAIVDTYEKGLMLTTKSQEPNWMGHKLMLAAPLIRQISIAHPNQGNVLIIGIGATTKDTDSVIQQALRAVGHQPAQDQLQEIVNTVDFEAMARRLDSQANEQPEEDNTLSNLGFTPTGADHSSEK